MKEQKILEYLRELNRKGELGDLTFGEVLTKVIEKVGSGLSETRRVVNKYLDEEFQP